MLAFEKAVLSAVAGFSASASGRFWIQLLILVVVGVVGGVLLWDRAKAIQHNRVQETAEDYDIALGAKDAVVASLIARIDDLEARADWMKAREVRLQAELEDVKRTLGARIASLEARLVDFECLLAQSCGKRKRPSMPLGSEIAVEGTD